MRASILCAAIVAIVAGMLALTEVSDPDLGFHLATGRAILALGHLPATNVLSFAQPDHPWLLHQGWPAVAFELAWRPAGFLGVLLLKVALVVGLCLLVYRSCRNAGAQPVLSAGCTLLGAWAAAGRFVERPFLAGDVCVAGVVALLAARRVEAPARTERLRLAAIALVIAIAFQLHAGAIFAVFVVVGAAGLELLVAWIDPSRRSGCTRRAAGLAAGSAAGVLVAALVLTTYHPFGGRAVLFPFDMATDSTLAEHIVEFRPPWRFAFGALTGYWLLVGALVLSLPLRWPRIPVGLLAAAAVGLAASMRHARFADLLMIGGAPALAAALTSLVPGARGPRLAPLALAAVAGLSVFHQWSWRPPGVGPSPWTWPLQLFAVVRRDHLVGPAFVSDVWAGPWLGLFHPAERVFFHPSFEAYSRQFAIGEYMAIRRGDPGALDRLDHHRVELCILRYSTVGERSYASGRSDLRAALARDRRWALVAFDDVGAVFVRREGKNRDAASRLAIDGLDPEGPTWLGDPAAAGASLERAWIRGPQSHLLEQLVVQARSARPAGRQ